MREEIRLALDRSRSASRKQSERARSFIEIGGDQAYFRHPAAATAEEGDRVFDILAGMIVTSLDETEVQTEDSTDSSPPRLRQIDQDRSFSAYLRRPAAV